MTSQHPNQGDTLTKTITDLAAATGVDVHDHLPLEDLIPIIDGIQAQGDLLVIPAELLTQVTARTNAAWVAVPKSGVEVLRGAAGGNPHVLVADAGTCRWTTEVTDRDGLALGILDATAPVWLLHPEHGGSGIAAGRFVIRRQREQADVQRLVAD